MAQDDFGIFQALHPLLYTAARFKHLRLFARFDALHIDLDITGGESKLCTTARHVNSPGAGDHGFGGHTTYVHAGAAKVAAFDDGCAQALLAATLRQRGACLACAYDNRIKSFSGHMASSAGESGPQRAVLWDCGQSCRGLGSFIRPLCAVKICLG